MTGMYDVNIICQNLLGILSRHAHELLIFHLTLCSKLLYCVTINRCLSGNSIAICKQSVT